MGKKTPLLYLRFACVWWTLMLGICKKQRWDWQPTPRLRLNILSMKTTNSIGDKHWQPWRRPTPKGNNSDFLPGTRTQHSLWSVQGLDGPRIGTPSSSLIITAAASPTLSFKGPGHTPSPAPQNTCRVDEHAPRPPPWPTSLENRLLTTMSYLLINHPFAVSGTNGTLFHQPWKKSTISFPLV